MLKLFSHRHTYSIPSLRPQGFGLKGEIPPQAFDHLVCICVPPHSILTSPLSVFRFTLHSVVFPSLLLFLCLPYCFPSFCCLSVVLTVSVHFNKKDHFTNKITYTKNPLLHHHIASPSSPSPPCPSFPPSSSSLFSPSPSSPFISSSSPSFLFSVLSPSPSVSLTSSSSSSLPL